MATFYALPLADKGFVPVNEFSNPVRWYVAQDGKDWPVYGPYASREAAEAEAKRRSGGF